MLAWDEAEAVLEERGIGWLSGVWEWPVDGRPERVRLLEVSPARVLVAYDDGGSIHTKVDTIELPFPAPAARKAGEAAPPAPTAKEMEDRLAAAADVSPDAYRALAGARAPHARPARSAADSRDSGR